MPGPSKGYVSKKDPRRKKWEALQGTSAGGGYYTGGEVPNVAPDSATGLPVNTRNGRTVSGPATVTAIEALESFRAKRNKASRRDKSRRKEKGVFDVSAATQIADTSTKKAGRAFEGSSGEPGKFKAIDRATRSEKADIAQAPKDRKKAKKAARNEIINQTAEKMVAKVEPLPTNIRWTAEEKLKNAAERANIADLTATQKDRELLVAEASRQDWRKAQKDSSARGEKGGITTSLISPWRGVTDKSPASKKRQVIRRLANDQVTGRGAQPIMPREVQAELDRDNMLEEMIGLGLTPADIAMAVPGIGWAGRGFKGARGAMKAVNAADDLARGTESLVDLEKLSGMGLKGSQAAKRLADEAKTGVNAAKPRVFTTSGKGVATERATKGLKGASLAAEAARRSKNYQRYAKARAAMKTPTGKAVKRSGAVSVLGGAAASGYGLPFVEGTAQGLYERPGKTLSTTARGLISGVTAPVVAAANLGLSAKRLLNDPALLESAATSLTPDNPLNDMREQAGLTAGTPQEGELDYALAPAKRTVEEWETELERMAKVYGSKDVDKIAEATQEDYGLLNAMGAYWLARPLTKGATRAAGQWAAERLPTVDRYGSVTMPSERSLADALADKKTRHRTTAKIGRERGNEQHVTRQQTKPLTQLRQEMNPTKVQGRDRSRSNVQRKLEDFNKDRSPDNQVSIENLASAVASKGWKLEEVTHRKLRNIQRNKRPGTADHSIASAFLDLPELLARNNRAGSVFAEMVQHMRDNNETMKAERFVSDVESGRAPDIDQNAIKMETVASAEEMRDPGTPKFDVRRPEESADLEVQARQQAVEAEMRGNNARARALRRRAEKLKEEQIRLEELERVEGKRKDRGVPELEQAEARVKEDAKRAPEVEKELKGARTRRGEIKNRLRALNAQGRRASGYRARRKERGAREGDRAKAGRKRLRSTADVVSDDVAANRLTSNRHAREQAQLEAELKMIDERVIPALNREMSEARLNKVRLQARRREAKLGKTNPDFMLGRQREKVKTEEQRIEEERKALDEAVEKTHAKHNEVFGSLSRQERKAIIEREKAKGAGRLDAEGNERIARLDLVDRERVQQLEDEYNEAAAIGQEMVDEAATPEEAAAIRAKVDEELEQQRTLIDVEIDQMELEAGLPASFRSPKQQFNRNEALNNRLRTIEDSIDREIQRRNSGQLTRKGRAEANARIRELRKEAGLFTELLRRNEIAVASTLDNASVAAALVKARADKMDEQAAQVVQAHQITFDAFIRDLKERYQLEEAIFTRNRDEALDVPETVRPASGPQGFKVRQEQFRSGDRARAGTVDRSYKNLVDTWMENNKAMANRRISAWLIAEAAYHSDRLGRGKQRQFTKQEVEILRETDAEFRKGYDRGKWVMVPGRVLDDPRLTGDLLKNVDKFTNDGVREFAETANTPGTESALAQKVAAKGEGERFYLVDEAAGRRAVAQERDLNGLDKFFSAANTVASRLVLGTSVSWMLAQPIAEGLVLAADHPNPVKIVNAIKRRQQLIAENPEIARQLAYLAGSPLGIDPATKVIRDRSIDRQSETAKGIKEFNRTTAGQQLTDLAMLRTLGNIDRWKGAIIREAGTLLEIDRSLSRGQRGAKAVKGQLDEIERVADLLEPLTDAERIRYLNSKEGMAAGERITRNIDASLGNWLDLSPIEKNISSLIFFYPFVRFSLNWTLRTYPKRHPVRWTAATMLGNFNAEIMERYMEGDPAFMSDWAAVPIWGDETGPPLGWFPVNRFAPGGNAIIEAAGGIDFKPTTIFRATTPIVNIGGGALWGRNEYGDPIEGQGFGIDDFSLGDVFRAGADRAGDLAFPIRELKRYANINYENTSDNPLDPSNFSLNLNGRKAIPGDDPNGARAAAVRFAGPWGYLPFALPGVKGEGFMPHEFAAQKRQYGEAWKRYIEANGEKTPEYTDEEKEARDRLDRHDSQVTEKEANWKKQIAAREGLEGTIAYDSVVKKHGEWKDRMRERRQKIKSTAAYKAYEKRQKGAQYYERVAIQASKELEALSKKTGTELSGGPQGILEAERESRARARKERREEARKVPIYAPGTSTIIGYEGEDDPPERQTSPRRVDLRADPENAPGTNSPGLVGPGVPRKQQAQVSGEPTKRRQAISESLVNDTRTRLAKQGVRRATNLDNPMADPMTKVVKGKRGNIAVKYRGAPVMGKSTVSELRRAEKEGTLDRDQATGAITTPKVRRVVAKTEKTADRVVKLSKKAGELQAKAGGVPTGVPAQYRGAVKKWGAYLEKRMKANGLVGVEGGLPQGMSGAEYLAKILQAESGWDERIGHPDNTSSASAQGLGQFIPSTRQAFLEQFGVDAYADAEQQIQAAAYHLDGDHTAGGLESYNPGFPADSDGTWGYYLDQDVGQMKVTNPKAKARLKEVRGQIEAAQKDLKRANGQARALGLETVEPKVTATGEIAKPQKVKGSYAGSKRIVGKILGAPVFGDWGQPESDPNGYHNSPNAYAQDIALSGPNGAENEPTYTQELLDKVTRRIRAMGGEVPDLTVGMGYTTGYVQGYELEIIPDSESNFHGTAPHFHIGARWVGENPPPGTVMGGSGATASGGGGTGGSGFGQVVGGPPVPGGGGEGGGGQAWNALQDFRINSKNLPNWGGGTAGTYTSASAAEGIAGQEGVEGVESAIAGIANLPKYKRLKVPGVR
jgi:hypothetical protein